MTKPDNIPDHSKPYLVSDKNGDEHFGGWVAFLGNIESNIFLFQSYDSLGNPESELPLYTTLPAFEEPDFEGIPENYTIGSPIGTAVELGVNGRTYWFYRIGYPLEKSKCSFLQDSNFSKVYTYIQDTNSKTLEPALSFICMSISSMKGKENLFEVKIWEELKDGNSPRTLIFKGKNRNRYIENYGEQIDLRIRYYDPRKGHIYLFGNEFYLERVE